MRLPARLAPVVLGALLPFGCKTPSPGFWELPDLPGGEDISYAYAITADGDLVVGESFSSLTASHGEGVRWVRSGLGWIAIGLGLPAPPPTPLNSPALGLAADGTALVGRVSFDRATSPTIDTLAYCWRETGGFKLMPIPVGFVEAQGQSATEGGARVVGWGSDVLGYEHPKPLVWTGSFLAGWSVAVLPPGFEGMAVGIDESARTAIGWVRSPGSAAQSKKGIAHEAACWIWKSGMWRLSLLGALPGRELYSQANGLSRPTGHFVVGFCGDPSLHSVPVRWRMSHGSPTGVEQLELLHGLANGTANAVSRTGRRVVGSCYGERDGEFVSDSFVWDEGQGTRSIQELLLAAGVTGVAGWALTSAAGISDDGRTVCGYGTNPQGIERAWVATIP